MSRESNFIRQQGFPEPDPAACAVQYRGLQFQPRVIGVLIVAGGILRSPFLFIAVSAALAWSALLPELSPFDWAYNHLIAARKSLPPLPPAPAPRRFAQALAAAMMAGIAAALLTGHQILAAVVAALLFAAIGAILFGGFCFGSFTFHLLTGNGAFARRTLPWVQVDRRIAGG